METIQDLENKVKRHMLLHYNVDYDDLEFSEVPGYWRDKEAKIHPGHPLHGCLFCEGPFKATYTYYDPCRDRRGRFTSRTRTWQKLYNTQINQTRKHPAK
ncbi:MAG: hypothetical protein PVG39_22130 [Desulfobacteraceae bacterium]